MKTLIIEYYNSIYTIRYHKLSIFGITRNGHAVEFQLLPEEVQEQIVTHLNDTVISDMNNPYEHF